jgi:hypothetical protein
MLGKCPRLDLLADLIRSTVHNLLKTERHS